MTALGLRMISMTVVIARCRAKFQGKQGVLTPGHRRIHVDLVLSSAQMCETFSSGGSKIHLNN